MEKINVWFVVNPNEDGRAEIEWFLKEEDAENAAEEVQFGEPLCKMVETYVGSNIHRLAR